MMEMEINEGEGASDVQVTPVLSPADLLLSISDLWSLLLSISVDSFFSLDFPLVLAKLPDFLFTSFSLFPSFLLTSSSFLRLSGFASVWSLWLFVSRSWDILPAGRTWKWNSFWDGNNFSSKTQIWSQHSKKYWEQKSRARFYRTLVVGVRCLGDQTAHLARPPIPGIGRFTKYLERVK